MIFEVRKNKSNLTLLHLQIFLSSAIVAISMAKHTSKSNKPAVVTLPLAGIRPLYSSKRGGKLVVEVDIGSMKRVNEPNTIDEMVAEARLEHALGKTKAFTSAEALIKELRS